MTDLYKNIKARRIELGLTQEELAQKTGYVGRSMLARIEKGEIDLPQSKVELFARALHCTQAELLGESARQKAADEIVIESEKLNRRGKEKLLDYVRLLQKDNSCLKKADK